MDSETYLQQFRNNYFIGNYLKNIESWKEVQDDAQAFGDSILKIDFLISRSLISQTKLCQKVGLGSKKDSLTNQFQGITNLTNKYLGSMLLNQKSSEDQKQEFEDFYEDRTQTYVHYLIWLYMGLQSGSLEQIMKSEQETESVDFPFKEDLEIIYLQFMAFLYGNNLQGAKTKLSQLRAIDDEDILTLLAQTYYHMNTNDEQKAIQYLDEMKERFGDSGFLINLKVAILMRQRKFNIALQLSQQLHKLLTTKENLFNKSELEVCLTNLVSLIEHSNKGESSDEYIQQLFQLNEGALSIQRSQHTSNTFDQLSEALSASK